MAEPKLNLTLVFPKSTMASQLATENKVKELAKEHNLAKQVLKMSQKAYKTMLEESISPKYNKVVAKSKGKLIRVWDTMSEDARIRKHCELIAHDMRAIDFSFSVLED